MQAGSFFTDKYPACLQQTECKPFYGFGWNTVIPYVRMRKLRTDSGKDSLRDKDSACKYEILNTYLSSGWVMCGIKRQKH